MNKFLPFLVAFILCASPILAAQSTVRPGRTDAQFQKDAGSYITSNGAKLLGKKRIVPNPSFFNGGRGGQMIRLGEEIFVVERTDETGESDKTGFLDLNSFKWRQGPTLPTQVDDQGAIGKSENGETVVITLFEDTLAGADIYVCDISAESCNAGADANFMFSNDIDNGSSMGGMNGHMPRVGDTLYYAGGFEGASAGNAFIAYNIKQDTWTRLADIPDTTDLGSLSPVVTKGGTDYLYHMSGEVNGGSEDDNMYRYNLDTDTWTQLDDIPTALDGEGGEFLRQTFGDSNTILGFQQGSGTNNAGQIALFHGTHEEWHMVAQESPAHFNMTQLSMETLNVDVKNNLITVTAIMSSQELWWDNYAISTIKFYDSE